MDAAVVVVATSKTSRRRVLPRAKVVGALRSSGKFVLDPSSSSHLEGIIAIAFPQRLILFVPDPLDTKGVFPESRLSRESGKADKAARADDDIIARTDDRRGKKTGVCVRVLF